MLYDFKGLGGPLLCLEQIVLVDRTSSVARGLPGFGGGLVMLKRGDVGVAGSFVVVAMGRLLTVKPFSPTCR